MNEISIEVIYHHIAGKLSENEQHSFDVWIEEPGHKAYYERIKCYYELQKKGNVSKPELDEAWKNLKKRVEKQNRKNQGVIGQWLMAIAASIIVILGVAWFLTRPSDQIAVIENLSLGPGQATARLELANGQIYDLKDIGRKAIQRIGQHIKVDSGCLNYARLLEGERGEKAYNRLIVPRGGEFQLQLEDGTKIWLNSASKIRYPEYFSDSCREVFLEGEAYFEVAKDAGRPFIVYAGSQKVTVVGTSFGITSYPDEEIQSTTLVKGKVKVEFPEVGGNTYWLEPGLQVAYCVANQQIEKKSVNVREFVSWIDGKYVFSRKRLEIILNTLSRWYDFQVFYQNQEAREVVFSGELLRFENFSDILKAIEKSSDVRFSINGRTIVVSK